MAGGCVALAFGPLDPGLVISGVAGAAAIVGVAAEKLASRGPEAEKELAKIRTAVFDRFKDDIIFNRLPPADLNAADEALERALPDCIVDMSKFRLADAAVSEAGFAKHAAALIVDALGKSEAIFAVPKTGGNDTCRVFARAVIEAALTAAVSRKEYFAEFQPFLLNAMAQGVGRVEAKVDREAEAARLRHEELLTLIRGVGGNTPEKALIEAARKFGEVKPDASNADLAAHLEYFAGEYRKLREQMAALAAKDNRLRGAQQAAEEALAQGDLDAARRYLTEAVSIRAERAKEARAQWEQTVRDEADSLAALAQADLMALDWQAADGHWSEAAESLAVIDGEAAKSLVWDAAEALRQFGERFGRSGAMRAAIARWRTLLAKTAPDEAELVGSLQNNLGNALSSQGMRSGGADGVRLLAEAVDAFRAALRIYTETEMPACWAMTQNNLGNALSSQGMRSGGAGGVRLLAEAVETYRAALRVYTEDKMPTDWATTQNNLGAALSSQGMRGGGADGVRLLAEAVEAYRAALRVRTETEMPADWAMTQNNLGAALFSQGMRSGGADGVRLLAEAVEACRAALRIYTETEMPAQWAMTQNNLGAALGSQGMRRDGADGVRLLAEAVDAYRAALRVYTETEMPADWAATQYNLGTALFSQGKRSGGAEAQQLYKQAEEAVLNALRIWTAEHFPQDHQDATELLQTIRDAMTA
jgi:hypothetical protein